MTKHAKHQDKPAEAAEQAAARPLGGTERTTVDGQNAGTSGNLYEVRATDAFEQGKEKLGLDSSNGSPQMAAHSFESRVQQGGSAH